jgi:alpha-1,2-mannosyltransferase
VSAIEQIRPAAAAGGVAWDSPFVRFWGGVLVILYLTFLAILWARGFYPWLPDFSVLFAAGTLTLTGHAAAAYDWASIARLQPVPGWPHAFFAPPWVLIAAAPLGLLPYFVAATIWLGIGLAVFVAALRAILPGPTATMMALAAPPVLFNLIWGQNGLLLAGLLGGALALLDTRPIMAGILIGLSAFKPQFGVLLPFFLAVTGRWRVFAAAALSLAVLALVSLPVLGWAPWAAFAGAAGSGLGAYAHQGPLAGRMDWTILGSFYGLMRTLGFSAASAGAVQIAVSLIATAGVLWLAIGRAPEALKAAALAIAMLLAAPYNEYNDWGLFTVALAFLLRDGAARGFGRWERPAIAIGFLVPLLCIALPQFRLFGLLAFAWLLGPILCALTAALLARRLLRPG